MTTSRFVTSVLIVLSAVALSLSALSVTSCKPKGAEVPVTGIAVSQPALSITEGETATISYTVEPSDASIKGVAFSSSAPARPQSQSLPRMADSRPPAKFWSSVNTR